MVAAHQVYLNGRGLWSDEREVQGRKPRRSNGWMKDDVRQINGNLDRNNNVLLLGG